MSRYATAGLKGATAGDLAWLEGTWRGEFKGDPVEEQWSGPAGGTLMAMFRWLRDGRVRFFELVTVEPGDEGLLLRIKHFNPGLISWEEKEESVTFLLVELRGEEAVFFKQDSETPLWTIYRKTGENSLVAFFEKEGEPVEPENLFYYTRAQGG